MRSASFCLALLLVHHVTGFSPASSQSQPPSRRRLGTLGPSLGKYRLSAASRNNNNVDNNNNSHVVIIGKVILDKYGDPQLLQSNDDDSNEVTIGGGGPQAAFGACASLAVRDLLLACCEDEDENKETWQTKKPTQRMNNDDDPPPKQRVTFLAPIGLKNWTPDMTNSLNALLPMLQSPPILATSTTHITPTIHIWHDENEVVNWMPVDGSFGEEGAGGLWCDRPCAQDVLDAIEGCCQYDDDDDDNAMNIALHSILEAGSSATNKGLDAMPFYNVTLMNRISVAGIEPIVFPNEDTGLVSEEDGAGVISLLERVEDSLLAASSLCKEDEKKKKKMLIVSPDRACYEGLISNTNEFVVQRCKEEEEEAASPKVEFVIRDGANGSFFINDNNNKEAILIPSATLNTPDGITPLNPTGAGNAYSGAYFACRATGSSAIEAACIANAVGAAVCEYENLPPWTWGVLQRVAEAACEVRSKVKAEVRETFFER